MCDENELFTAALGLHIHYQVKKAEFNLDEGELHIHIHVSPIIASHGVIAPISGVARVCIPPGFHTEEWNTRMMAKHRLRTLSGIIIRASP